VRNAPLSAVPLDFVADFYAAGGFGELAKLGFAVDVFASSRMPQAPRGQAVGNNLRARLYGSLADLNELVVSPDE
jgi:hypothetical protein